MMKYVCVAPARSGTKYVSTLLTEAGMRCGHESVFNSWGQNFSRAPRWQDESHYWGDSSYIAAPFMPEVKGKLTTVHLVRPPLDQIRSVVGLAHVGDIRNQWVQFLDAHINLTQFRPGPQRAAAYWVRWHRLIEEAGPDLTWQLSDITADEIMELALVTGIEVDPQVALKAVEETSTLINHRTRADWVTLEDLGRVAHEVVAAAERYGVPLETPKFRDDHPDDKIQGYEPSVEVHDWMPEHQESAGEVELVLNHTGAGWYELIDSGGDVVSRVRGKAAAEERRVELARGTTDASIAEGDA